jgi:hypothetical protein
VRVEDKRGSESCVCIGKQRGVQAKEGSTNARARLKSTLSGPYDGAHVTTLRVRRQQTEWMGRWAGRVQEKERIAEEREKGRGGGRLQAWMLA